MLLRQEPFAKLGHNGGLKVANMLTSTLLGITTQAVFVTGYVAGIAWKERQGGQISTLLSIVSLILFLILS